MSITSSEIKESVYRHAEARGIKLPESFSQDFDEVFGNVGEIKTLTNLQKDFCAKLKEALENPELKEKYEDIVKELLVGMRIQLARALNFEAVVTSIRQGKSSRQMLKDYIATLDNNYAWTSSSLRAWKPEGPKLIQRIYQLRLPWTEEVVRMILGEEADAVLAEHPFIKEHEVRIPSKISAKKYFSKFVKEHLEEKQNWEFVDLYDWPGCTINGVFVTGEQLYGWIKNNIKNLQEETARELLGEDAEEILKLKPFEKSRLTTRKQAGDKLWKWMKTQLEPGQEWGPGVVDRTKGYTSLIAFIRNNIGPIDREVIRKLLNPKGEDKLKKYPFKMRKIHITTRRDVILGMAAFYKSLNEGEPWNVADLENYKDGPVPGKSIVEWVYNNFDRKGVGEHDWDTALARISTLEQRTANPLRRGRKDRPSIDEENIAA